MTDAVEERPEVATSAAAARRKRSRSAAWQKWSRLIHAYTSMIALLLVLFFGITGITLNHPEWTFGDAPTTTTKTGTMTFEVAPDGNVDYLRVSEFLRDRYAISADVSDYQTTGNQGSISYRAPGYAADASFDTSTGAYRVTIEQQGFVGVMNDLHKGRDAPGAWKWVIDVSAGLLVLVSVTGLGIQLFQRKRRTRALVFAGLGLVATVVLVWIALA